MEQKNINPIEEAADSHLKDSFIESLYDGDYFQCMVSMSSLACANCKGNHFISSSISSKIKFLGIFSGLIIHHSILDKITNLRIRIKNGFFSIQHINTETEEDLVSTMSADPFEVNQSYFSI